MKKFFDQLSDAAGSVCAAGLALALFMMGCLFVPKFDLEFKLFSFTILILIVCALGYVLRVEWREYCDKIKRK